MASIVVVGLGYSGCSAARILRQDCHSVTVIESKNDSLREKRADKLRSLGITVKLGTPLNLEAFKNVQGLKTVVVSPGIAWDHPTLQALRNCGVQVQGEMAVAWSHLRHCPWVGVTGTNGKTTVAHLLNHVLESAGLHAPMGGNVGAAATELALRWPAKSENTPDWFVIELSSYQIEAAPEVAPAIGIWTTLTSDHLERHGTLSAYRSIKRGLLERSSIPILNADDPDLSQQRPSWRRGMWVSTSGPGTALAPHHLWIDAKDQLCNLKGPLFQASVLRRMIGEHNRQNLLLATAAALQIGLSPNSIVQGLQSFPGLPHRLELIGYLHDIKIFNDSKATNYAASAAGLRSVPVPTVVLAGGEIKQGDVTDWLHLMHSCVIGVVLFGAGAKWLQNLLYSNKYPGHLKICNGLEEAVPLALKLAINLKACSLLLSPACASFDQYPNFEARGEHFRSIIHSLS
ncbi:UDP-N-acetylmuramoyl-L-alanine--D-glutamate ligase [cyanobiont of Ornithocercus magnificus]|nr:UDP-N-acetylmuramoyl-L-alanine--D-glutamate ligase [cyanobiont of Ornithocercus magnificus]